MIRTLAAVTSVALTAVLAVGGGTALARGHAIATAACTPSTRTVGGLTEKTFCGRAKATIKVGGKTFTLKQGACVSTSAYLTVNIGTFVHGHTTKPKPDYFGLDVGRVPGTTAPPAGKDGTYTKGVSLAVNHGAASYLVDSDMAKATATLAGSRSHGTVTGTTVTGQTLTASFHC
jgi:hypothetical protein